MLNWPHLLHTMNIYIKFSMFADFMVWGGRPPRPASKPGVWAEHSGFSRVFLSENRMYSITIYILIHVLRMDSPITMPSRLYLHTINKYIKFGTFADSIALDLAPFVIFRCCRAWGGKASASYPTAVTPSRTRVSCSSAFQTCQTVMSKLSNAAAHC